MYKYFTEREQTGLLIELVQSLNRGNSCSWDDRVEIAEKQIVKNFIDFLEKHPDSIICTGDNSYSYSTLRDSIVKTLQMAYGDGEVKGFNDCRSQELFDKTLISSAKDW